MRIASTQSFLQHNISRQKSLPALSASRERNPVLPINGINGYTLVFLNSLLFLMWSPLNAILLIF